MRRRPYPHAAYPAHEPRDWEQQRQNRANSTAWAITSGVEVRSDPSLLPPQAPAGASMDELLAAVPRGGIAWLAFGNSGVTEMLLNWAHHVIALGLAHRMVVAAFDVPLLFLCDTPGFMVGADHERQAAVRKLCRMFTIAASLTVPFFTVVVRKSYGLGAQASV